MSLSLVEKLALTGAFLGLVAMAVGTDEDPGLVAEQAEVLAARAKERGAQSATSEPMPAETFASAAEPPPSETPPVADANEGNGAANTASDSEPGLSAPPVQPSSPPDDESSQRDMRKVLAAQN